jgi:hypothetical protein
MPKLFLLSLVSCLWAAWIAQKKGRSTLFWSFLGSLFPVVVPVLLHTLPPVVRPAAPGTCPGCGRPVQEGSRFCRFCGREL